MKTTVASLLVLASASAALAQGRGVTIDTPAYRMRAGTTCQLTIHGLTLPGTCTVARVKGDNETVVSVGRGTIYIIDRDLHDKTMADFYRELPSGKREFVASVGAVGNCWVGRGVSFCAR
jgi:hypothetical protein